MAKVSAPLLSQSATGTISGLITYETRASRSYAYRKKIRRGLQKGPAAGYGRSSYGASYSGFSGYLSPGTLSELQSARRQVFASGRASYASLSPAEKQEYTDRAALVGLTGALLFQREYMNVHSL